MSEVVTRPVVEGRGSRRSRSTLDAQSHLKVPSCRPAACCRARMLGQGYQLLTFYKIQISMRNILIFKYQEPIPKQFKHCQLNTSAAGFSPQLPSCNPFKLFPSWQACEGKSLQTFQPVGQYRKQSPQSIMTLSLFQTRLPTTQLQRGYRILCPQGWASQNMVSSHTFLPTSTQQPLTCCHLSLFPLNPV